MPQGSTSPMPMDIRQAQAVVECVENPQNTVGVGLLSWARYYEAKIHLLQSQLPMSEKTRYTHLYTHPRALTAVELEQYISREVEYLRERLAYIEKKLQELWQTAGLTDQQGRIVREGLELCFTYRELTEMWERGI
jgi:phosphoenolpyruvate carboxylase